MMPMRMRSLAPKTLEAANVPASPVATLPMKLRRDCMGKNSLGVNNNYTTRARPVMTPEPPLGYACVSCHRLPTRRLYPPFSPARSHVLRTATVRERMVVTPVPPLAHARGSLTRHIATPVPAGQLQSNLEARAHRIWQRRPCADAPAHGPARSVSLHRYRHPPAAAWHRDRSGGTGALGGVQAAGGTVRSLPGSR